MRAQGILARPSGGRRSPRSTRMWAWAGLVSALLLGACGLPRLFELTINEELGLQDGSIVTVETTVQYQRTDLFSKYENALRRVTTLKFDAGPPYGRIVFTTWLRPVFLDQIDGKWYLVLTGQGPFGKSDETADQWGHSFTTLEQRLAILEGRGFRPIPWELSPKSIQVENLFPLIDAKVLAELSGKTVSRKDKQDWLTNRVADPSRRQITRPAQKAPSSTQGARQSNGSMTGALLVTHAHN